MRAKIQIIILLVYKNQIAFFICGFFLFISFCYFFWFSHQEFLVFASDRRTVNLVKTFSSIAPKMISNNPRISAIIFSRIIRNVPCVPSNICVQTPLFIYPPYPRNLHSLQPSLTFIPHTPFSKTLLWVILTPSNGWILVSKISLKKFRPFFTLFSSFILFFLFLFLFYWDNNINCQIFSFKMTKFCLLTSTGEEDLFAYQNSVDKIAFYTLVELLLCTDSIDLYNQNTFICKIFNI